MNEISDESFTWLKNICTSEDYLDPDYYEQLLKEYAFTGKTDLEIVAEKLDGYKLPAIINILELGCGTGRVTQEIINKQKFTHLDLVDLSELMMSKARVRFASNPQIAFHKSDSLEFLLRSNLETYDLVVSLWSFSHSVHQTLIREGVERGTELLRMALERLFTKLMKRGGKFLLIHFDSQSEEQTILMKQWRRIWPLLNNFPEQSPSKVLLDVRFQELQSRGVINYTCRHLLGDPIVYDSMEQALEIFFNFHLESNLNNSSNLDEVMSDLRIYFTKFMQPSGQIAIRPGCFLFEITT